MKKILLLLCINVAGLAQAQYNPEIFDDLYTGSNPYNGINNLYFSAKLNNQLFFNRQNEFNYDLFVTDGTISNTHLLKNVTQVLNMVSFDGHIYFSFVDANNGAELWKTDGTVAGTILVSILGGSGIAAHNYVVAGNKLYFASGNAASPFLNQLFVLVAGSNTPILLNSNLKDVESITQLNDNVIFHGTELPDSGVTRELYFSDGTQAGTHILKDIMPGVGGSDPVSFKLFQNKLFFTADDGSAGRELWVTDGTTVGTYLVKDINPGAGDSFVDLVAGIYNNKMYFSANGAIWSTDGTSNGTVLFANLNAATGKNFVTVNNKLLFLANDVTHGFEIWSTDGTSTNTNLVLDINPGVGSVSYSLFESNAICDNQLFFDGDAGNFNIEPWVTDGTVAGTHAVADLNATGGSLDYETRYVQLNGEIFFSANPGTGRQLFVMDACENLNVIQNQSANIRIFPNPTQSYVTIDIQDKIDNVEIYNVLAQKIQTLQGDNKLIDLRMLNSGVYILKVTTVDNLHLVQRVIKR